MPFLTVINSEKKENIEFSGAPLLSDVLKSAGKNVPLPCGGLGKCGKCTVEAFGNLLDSESGKRLPNGKVCACHTQLCGNSTVILDNAVQKIETFTGETKGGKDGFGIAVDIGTTTVAAKLYDRKSGKSLSESAIANPQSAYGADVISRITAALDGKSEELTKLITDAVRNLADTVCEKAGIDAPEAKKNTVITGNTVMLSLLCAKDVRGLAFSPFTAETLFGCYENISGLSAYLPHCMGAFVGADITCAVLASGMCEKAKTSVLLDVGTNGEAALWHGGKLYTTATAAGPAFEGVGIECGCIGIGGAVDRVRRLGNGFGFHTIGGLKPVGICGSGVIDAVAALLDGGQTDSDGYMENRVFIGGDVYLSPSDIRQVQLAKGAVSAGLKTLLAVAGITANEVCRVYLAGGFGSSINPSSAARIGLYPPEWAEITVPLGNAALTGASMILCENGAAEKSLEICHSAETVELNCNPVFSEYFIDSMGFPEKE